MKRYLLLGKSGVGKSSFVNATFGLQLAPWSQFEPCTKLVELYARSTCFGDVCLIDTPGFAEDNLEVDLHYLELVKEEVSKNRIDAILYLSRLDDKRFRGEDKTILRLLTDNLGDSTWNSAWLIFTFCSKVSLVVLDETAKRRQVEIEQYLKSLHVNRTYRGFSKCILIDNIKKNWYPGAEVITKYVAEG